MHFVQQNVRNTVGGDNITVSAMSALGLSTPVCRREIVTTVD